MKAMKRILFLIGFLIVPVLLSTGCLPVNTNVIKTSLNQEFTLPVGQTAVINGEDLSLKFERVTTDSRCAKGNTCIWAGEAKCQVQVKHNEVSSSVVFTIPGSSEGTARNFIDGYTASFNLEPYPEAGKQIAESDYALLLKITK
jgi:hypothetical protein